VPYGRGSDFFFSGHAGFMIICASEWHKLNMPKLRNFVLASGIYTILILLTYRVHYSIDVFTGVFFAEWCFGKVDLYKDHFDGLVMGFMIKLRKLLNKKYSKLIFMGQDVVTLTQQE